MSSSVETISCSISECGWGESLPLADFRCLLRGRARLLAACGGSFFLLFLLSCGFDWSRQVLLGRFRSTFRSAFRSMFRDAFRGAMVPVLQWLDARSFFVRSQLSVRSFLPFFLKIFRNRLSSHN